MKVGLFPGQGIAARTIAAGLDFDDPLVALADEHLGYALRKRVEICARSLPTDVAQPAIFVVGVSSFARRGTDDGFHFLAGHSLGEFAALVAGGAISFEDGLRVVARRGKAMHEAARTHAGGMIAVLSLDPDVVADIAGRAGVHVANDNAPGQVVVSGSEQGLARAARLARSAGGRSILLEVEGPFHTAAMSAAAEPLRRALDHIEVRSPDVPVISNVTARPYRAPGEIRSLLVTQLTGPVLFRQSLEWVWQQGVREWCDLGPGEVVGKLARRTFDACGETVRA